MPKAAYAAFTLPLLIAFPALAQTMTTPAQPATEGVAPAQQPADSVPTESTADAAQPVAAATPLTPAQIEAFNKAVSDFTAGQTAQQGGDNATATAKYTVALPAIRTAVQAQPDNIDNVTFLANALYANAAAQAALGNMDQVIALFAESAPYFRKVVAAKPTDVVTRNIFVGVLTQLGNSKLSAQDKVAADPLYAEAATLARKSVAEKPGDAAAKNLLLSALIGQSQTSADAQVREEALSMGKAMLANGTIDAVNKPSVEIMTGVKAAG